MSLQEITIYRNPNEGVISYYRSSDGKSFPLQLFSDNIFKIREAEPFIIKNGVKKEYDILPIKTNDNIPTYQLKTKQKIIAIAGGGSASRRNSNVAGSCLTNVTYSQLIALIIENRLEAGCNYKITDFRTRERIPNTTEIILGDIEPLIVQAITTNSIDETNILSTVYPEDRIYYEVINSTSSADDRGRIYYREETVLDVIAGYNWRVIKFRRWESVVEAGKFIVLTDNGGAFQDFYTFNNSPSAENCNATHIGMITDSIIPFALSMGVDISDKLNNFIIGSLAPDIFTVDNNFADDCFYNTIICLGDGTILSNRASALFAGFPPVSGEFTGKFLL